MHNSLNTFQGRGSKGSLLPESVIIFLEGLLSLGSGEASKPQRCDGSVFFLCGSPLSDRA